MHHATNLLTATSTTATTATAADTVAVTPAAVRALTSRVPCSCATSAAVIQSLLTAVTSAPPCCLSPVSSHTAALTSTAHCPACTAVYIESQPDCDQLMPHQLCAVVSAPSRCASHAQLLAAHSKRAQLQQLAGSV
eukprot:3970-Heterococcus_DN1.PRE.1